MRKIANFKLLFVLLFFSITIEICAQKIDSTQTIKEVVISRSQTNIEQLATRQIDVITQADLQKSACCNLSESFENSATVDVSYSDAITGAKQIKMLGLEGIYAQNLVENMPGIRGLNNTFGMTYVPGPWLKSIQLTKGIGSVTNGFESITGQINVEFKKPQSAEKFFTNFYLNQDMRTELILYNATILKNPKWSVANFLHGQINWLKRDMNKDNFLDNPLNKQFNYLNRWNYFSGKKFYFNSSIFFTYEDRTGGENSFKGLDDFNQKNYWGIYLKTIRTEGFAKFGYSLSENASLLFQTKYSYHQQAGNIGWRKYDANEHFAYANLHFQQRYQNDDDNKLKLGLSLQASVTYEKFDTFVYTRKEIIPGFYAEYNKTFFDKLFFSGGVRVDYHNLYGTFLSPRVHLKYKALNALQLRASAGRGYRVPTVFAENFGALANNRVILFDNKISPEIAWNYGGSIQYNFNLNFFPGSITADFYRTQFENQLVVDLENPAYLQLYNLNGKSYANSFQIEFEYEIIKNLTTKIAYKMDDVKTTYNGIVKRKALKPMNKTLFTLNYVTKNKKWRFDMGLVWYGISRVPANSENSYADSKSKNLFLLNAQVTYVLKRVCEFYVGGENMANQMQPNPIISPSNPFSNTFDASLIWGPTRGAMAFVGIRFKID